MTDPRQLFASRLDGAGVTPVSEASHRLIHVQGDVLEPFVLVVPHGSVVGFILSCFTWSFTNILSCPLTNVASACSATESH